MRMVAGQPSASIPPAAASEVVPIVGRVQGTKFFLSDVRIFNPKAIDQELSLYYVAQGLDGSHAVKATETIPAGRVLALDDIVLLLALGVDRDTVLDDYEATSLYRFPEDQHDSLANMLQAGISPEAAAGVLGTPRWAMAEAVDLLLGFPDGVGGFLTGPAGMQLGELAALRKHLVTPAEAA